ncbi:MAG: type II secretion system F family protein [Proteobacteria bacterium]|nr:type II secretion system F family protein [Pseudomonadota bacterium]
MDTRQIIIAVLATLGAGGLAFAFLEPLLSGANRAEKRQAALIEPRAKRRAAEDTSTRKRQISESLKELEARKSSKELTLEQRFERAGLDWTRQKFFTMSAVGGGIVALLLFVLTGQPVSLIGGGVIGGLVIPRWLLNRMCKTRTKKFLEEFPNAIEAIVRGIRSGLPLNDCFRLVANEAKEPVRSEFRTVIEAQTMGISVGEATARIYERIPTQEVNFFSIVIQIQSKSGGNLGEILHNLSKVIRDRKKLRDKVGAMSMEAKSSAAIIGALPFIVGTLVYFGSPDYISLLWTTTTGKMAMGAAAFIMFVGTMVMRAMINFEV